MMNYDENGNECCGSVVRILWTSRATVTCSQRALRHGASDDNALTDEIAYKTSLPMMIYF
jgi:hypothetical protein